MCVYNFFFKFKIRDSYSPVSLVMLLLERSDTMPQVIEKLYNSFYSELKTEKESSRIEQNKILLKHDFTKEQRKLLLAIIDDLGLIKESVSLDNFSQGFKLGAKLTTEIYQNMDGLSDEVTLTDEPSFAM